MLHEGEAALMMKFGDLLLRELPNCDAMRAAELSALTTRLVGIDNEFDRSFCKAILKRFANGNGIPPPVLHWVVCLLSNRAKGLPWDKAVQAHTTQKNEKTMALIEAVEMARAKGLATSELGDPGPAFEEAAKELGKSPATVRDRYYKLKKQGMVDLWYVSLEAAQDIVSTLEATSRKDS
jgi:hypothetical protein